MKSTNKTTTPAISSLTKYKIINIVIFIGIISTSIIGIFFTNKLSKSIVSKRLAVIAQQINSESIKEQQVFFESNPQIAQTLLAVLPDQDSIIQVVDSIESLQKNLGIPRAFEFSSMTPTKDTKNSYVSFLIKTNTTMINAISFLRVFEKLPYLTKITAVSIKTPQGVGGSIELLISARIYVQDPF